MLTFSQIMFMQDPLCIGYWIFYDNSSSQIIDFFFLLEFSQDIRDNLFVTEMIIRVKIINQITCCNS
ncbi:hypothetical protein LCR_06555 [Aeromonas enteropelogenes]|uniref:Uncharacterized protein n=1 Tax=Aeromonas enteropelogenes TaxID=29489 RepID=A0A175VKU2_AEREN|nr:hypothetical protein LCR_06555 [Aeromonas enteropelogenes]